MIMDQSLDGQREWKSCLETQHAKTKIMVSALVGDPWGQIAIKFPTTQEEVQSFYTLVLRGNPWLCRLAVHSRSTAGVCSGIPERRASSHFPRAGLEPDGVSLVGIWGVWDQSGLCLWPAVGPYARVFLTSRELRWEITTNEASSISCFPWFSEHPLPVGVPKTMVVTRQLWSLSSRSSESSRDPRLIPRWQATCLGAVAIFFNLIRFIFYCTGSSLLPGLSSTCDGRGLLSSFGACPSHCSGFSCCGARALGLAGSADVALGLSCLAARGILDSRP